jgi:hypothetical protein
MARADLAIWTVLAVVLDVVIGRFGFFGLLSYLAPSFAILILLIRRWGKWGLISVGVLALVHLFVYDAPFAIRAANALSLGALVLAVWICQTKPFQSNRVGYGFVVVLYLATYVTMFVLEAALSAFFGSAASILVSAVNHLANFIVGLGLLSIIDLQKTLFVNMERYLLDTASKGSME